MTFLGVLEEKNDLFLSFLGGCLKTKEEKKDKMQNVEKPQGTQRTQRER